MDSSFRYVPVGGSELLASIICIRRSMLGLAIVVFVAGPLLLWITRHTQVHVWMYFYIVIAILVLVHAYATLIFIRRCSRACYTNETLRKGISLRIGVIAWFVELAFYRWLNRAQVLACVSIAALSFIFLVVLGPISWPKVFFAIMLSLSFWACVLAWTTSILEFERPHGSRLLRRTYLSSFGLMQVPGDRWSEQHKDLHPCCFLSFHRQHHESAKSLSARLHAAGIEVEMYDPENLWRDAPDEIANRIEKMADCVVYLGKRERRSPWVRAEQAWAEKLYRPVFYYPDTSRDEMIIARVYRSARVPRVQMGEHFLISRQDEVFRAHLPLSVLRNSRMIERRSGLHIMRGLMYAEGWEKLEIIRAAEVAFSRVLWSVLTGVALLSTTLTWYWLPSRLGRILAAILILGSVLSAGNAVRAFRRR